MIASLRVDRIIAATVTDSIRFAVSEGSVAFAPRQQAQAEVAELAHDPTALRTQLTEASTAVISP
jgi:hypothetical protein